MRGGGFGDEQPPLEVLLCRAGSALARYRRQVAAVHGLTPTALGVLDALVHRGGLSHRELAAHLGLAPATLTPVVDALEARGQLGRERDPGDRRVVRLSATPAGRALVRTAAGGVADTMAGVLPPLRAGDAALVRGYLLALLAAVGEEELRW